MKMKPLWVSALRHGFNLAVFSDKVDPCNIYISPGGKDGMLRGTWDVTLTSLCKQMYGQPTSLCIGFTQLPPNVLVLTAYSDFQLMHNESLGTCFLLVAYIWVYNIIFRDCKQVFSMGATNQKANIFPGNMITLR